MRLYKVTCRGMQNSIGGQTGYGVAYVVAQNPDRAYRMVRDYLDARSIGFRYERELQSVELLAEAYDYPDCGTILHVESEQPEVSRQGAKSKDLDIGLHQLGFVVGEAKA